RAAMRVLSEMRVVEMRVNAHILHHRGGGAMRISPIRAVRAVIAFGRVVRDPRRLDEVLRLTAEIASPELVADAESRVASTAWGRDAMKTRIRLGDVDVQKLAALPEGTLGRAYARHMLDLGLDPRSLTAEADRSPWWMRAHMLETHDVWHVVTGFATDVPGEIGLQGFYLGNFPIGGPPLAITAIGLLHGLVYARDASDAIMRETVRGYLRGKRAKPMFGADWASMWTHPLSEVRARFAIDAAGVAQALDVEAPERELALPTAA